MSEVEFIGLETHIVSYSKLYYETFSVGIPRPIFPISASLVEDTRTLLILKTVGREQSGTKPVLGMLTSGGRLVHMSCQLTQHYCMLLTLPTTEDVLRRK